MAKVGCAGLLVEDTFCGPVHALPAEGALHMLDAMPVRAGGCAANVAINLSRQGVAAEVAGCVGEDGAAAMLQATFSNHGIGTGHVHPLPGISTSKTLILLIEGQDRRYFHVTGANARFTTELLPREWISSLKVFYLGGLFALPSIDLKRLAVLLAYCRSKGITTVVDVAISDPYEAKAAIEPLLSLIDVFVPNDDEARAFTGVTDPIDQLRELKRSGARTVIITQGSRGAAAAHGGAIWRCGAYEMNVVDPSGSGDAFTSGVIRGLLMNWEMPRILQYASAVGASATRAAGTTDAVFTAAEAESFIREHLLYVRPVS
jgi:sugar/nucleoside kinase (ribokinase family)